jgi:hypothetical protein
VKNLLTMLALSFFLTGNIAEAQIDKTRLSLDVSKQYKQNIALLAQHTWKRKVEGFVKGNLVMSSLSSVTVSPDYKLTAVVIQQQSYVEKKQGIRGAVQKSTMHDVNEYV